MVHDQHCIRIVGLYAVMAAKQRLAEMQTMPKVVDMVHENKRQKEGVSTKE